MPFDVEDILRQKSPRLLKFMPRLFIEKLRAIAHEDQVNEEMARIGHLEHLAFVDAALAALAVRVEIRGLDRVPAEDRIIVVANHPLGGLDGLALLSAIGQRKRRLVFLVNDILMQIPNLHTLFVPVDKYGSNWKYGERYRKVLASDLTILHFPAGLCSRQYGNRIQDLAWHKSFVTMARRYGRAVLPVYIEGANSNFFYTVANWRNRLRIPFNIETLFLIDEMFAQRNTTLRMRIGELIPHQALGSERTRQEWATTIRAIVYGLAEAPAETTPGVRPAPKTIDIAGC